MDYESPTTSGLKIDLKNYIIELVCINCSRFKKLSSRFWKSSKYWENKYKREIKGYYNLKLSLENKFDLEDAFISNVLIDIIKKQIIKSLSAKKTIIRIVKLLNQEVENKKNKYENMVSNSKPINNKPEYMNNNTKYVDSENKNKINILKRIEKNG